LLSEESNTPENKPCNRRCSDVDAPITAFLDAHPEYAPATRHAYRIRLRHWAKWLGVSRWRDVDAKALDRAIGHLATGGYTPQSRRAYYTALRSFADWLDTQRIHLPIERLPAINSRTEPVTTLTPQDVATLLYLSPKERRATTVRNVALCALFWATGITAKEACALNLGAIAWGDGALHVAGRVLPIYPGALRLLRRYARHARQRLTDDDRQRALFVGRYGGRMVLTECITTLRRFAARRGVTATPLTLRHTLALLLLREGMSIPDLQAFLGHASHDAAYRYYRALHGRG
jgi:site-specific recombinase XerD